jgi:hypothetical protein
MPVKLQIFSVNVNMTKSPDRRPTYLSSPYLSYFSWDSQFRDKIQLQSTLLTTTRPAMPNCIQQADARNKIE